MSFIRTWRREKFTAITLSVLLAGAMSLVTVSAQKQAPTLKDPAVGNSAIRQASVPHKNLTISRTRLDFDGDGITDYAVVRDDGAGRPISSGSSLGSKTGASSQIKSGSTTRGPSAGSNIRGYYFKQPGERFSPLTPRMQRPSGVADSLRWLINTSGPGPDLDIDFGTINDFPVPADYDGDGICDLAVWTGGSGAQFRVLTSGSGFNTEVDYVLGDSASDPSVVGDYDGDGFADPAVFDTNTGQWSYLGGPNHDVAQTVTPVGTFGGAIPIPGDFDGDGKFDFLIETSDVMNPTMGHFYLAYNDGTAAPIQNSNFVFGNYRDVVIPGDYDGDGATDIGIASVMVNPIAWRVRLSPSGDLIGPVSFGDPNTDYTVTGDYNGDQMGEFTIWHEPGQFQSLLAPAYTLPSTDFNWGQSGDYPVAYFNSH